VNILEMKNTELIKEFIAMFGSIRSLPIKFQKIAVVVMELEGNRRFNQWSRKLAESQAEEGQPIICVRIKKLKPLRSRIERLELKRVA